MNFSILSYLEHISLSTLETLIILVFIFNINKKTAIDIYSTVVNSAVYIFLTAALTYVNSEDLMFRILPILIIVTYIYSLTKQPIVHCIYLTIISYISIMVIQLIIVIVFPFTATMQNAFPIQIFANSLTLILTILMTRFLPIYNIYNFIVRKDLAFRFFLMNTFVVVTTINYFFVARFEHFMYYIVIIAIILALMIFVNIELLRSRFIVDKQQTIINSYNQYLPIVDELIEQVRSRQHGYDNNIQSLYALSQTCTDDMSLKKELAKHLDSITKSDLPAFLLKFNLKLLSGLLFQKYSITHKKNINMDFTIKNFNIKTDTPEYIIVEAVGILMDNAIEASDNDDTIYVTIDCTNNHFYFDIMNVGPVYTSDLHKKIFKRGYSTKAKSEKERGLGLPQLLDIIKAYKGNLDIGNRTRDDKQYIFFSIDI